MSGATYNHEIKDCTIDPGFENTCTGWLMFREENEADYLIGGGDIVHEGTVEIHRDIIFIYNKDSQYLALKFFL